MLREIFSTYTVLLSLATLLPASLGYQHPYKTLGKTNATA